MRIRLRFKKTGRLKYIGHLDLLNVWNRALKSAKLPVLYSKGFNPHMLISFAAPLPLGITSVSEYADVDFDDALDAANIADGLNRRFPDGLEVLEVYPLNQPYKRIAAHVTSAEYRILAPFDITEAQINGFLSQEAVEIRKKTKRNNEITDILPDIISVKTNGSRELLAVLSCGSVKNLKPTLFMEALCLFLKEDAPLYKISIERIEIFGCGFEGGLISVKELL